MGRKTKHFFKDCDIADSFVGVSDLDYKLALPLPKANLTKSEKLPNPDLPDETQSSRRVQL